MNNKTKAELSPHSARLLAGRAGRQHQRSKSPASDTMSRRKLNHRHTSRIGKAPTVAEESDHEGWDEVFHEESEDILSSPSQNVIGPHLTDRVWKTRRLQFLRVKISTLS
ncbi:unnamed protein product [Linum trigynum]|uniref:Uncharacterized protein n=1 Tax=Linum trigynum TaxID=586398 RepID=A0AAV2DZL7_9ROSI